MTDKKAIIHPAQRRLIEALAHRDVARYLRSQAASGNDNSHVSQNHGGLPQAHKAA